MVHVQYRPDPAGQGNPFVAGTAGQGPSSRHWTCSHLEWLGVDYSDDWPLYGKSSIFGAQISASSMDCIRSRLQQEAGRTWQDIVGGSDLDPHYVGLLELSELRSDERINCIPSSSVIQAPQDTDENGLEKAEPAFYPLTSPCTPDTPTRTAPVDPHAPRRDSQVTPSLSGSRLVAAAATTVTPLLVKSEKKNSLVTQPEQTKSPYSHGDSEEGAKTKTTSSLATHRLADRGSPVTPSKLRTPIAHARSARYEPQSTCSALQHSAYSLSSWLTDHTYTSTHQRPGSPRWTEDKSEFEVMMAGRTCLTVVQKVLEDLSASQLSSSILVPRALRLSVAGLLVNCCLDLVIRISLNDKPNQEMKCGEAYGEFKRLRHHQSDDNIRGQETASLLCQAALQRHGTSQMVLRSGPKRAKLTPKPIQVFLYCWHHLTGYVTQLEVWPEDLKAIEAGTRFDTDEQGAILEPRRPIQMKKSTKLDLKDARQRVEFLTAIAAMQLIGLQRHSRHTKVVADIRGEEHC